MSIRSFRSKIIVFGLAGITWGAVSPTGPADAAPTPDAPAPATASRYSDFETPVVQTTGAAQCAKPISDRTETWVCLDGAGTAGGSAGSGTRTPMAAQVGSGYSGAEWHLVDSTHAEFYGTFVWGAGTNVLGTGTNYVKWTLTGSQMSQNPVRFQVTRATTKSVFSGELFNGAAGVPHGGSPISACQRKDTPLSGSDITRTWPDGGCSLRDTNNYDHNMVAEMSWSTNGYTGNWWVYARSPVAHAADKHDFRFSSANSLPGDATNSGYDR